MEWKSLHSTEPLEPAKASKSSRTVLPCRKSTDAMRTQISGAFLSSVFTVPGCNALSNSSCETLPSPSLSKVRHRSSNCCRVRPGSSAWKKSPKSFHWTVLLPEAKAAKSCATDLPSRARALMTREHTSCATSSAAVLTALSARLNSSRETLPSPFLSKCCQSSVSCCSVKLASWRKSSRKSGHTTSWRPAANASKSWSCVLPSRRSIAATMEHTS
mmetsp:Transcript_124533/g.295505  ORF Transcript_124533/g.295505 Transcript_124533/m.295505 type:complete len:216 (-) Transcript_124533:904-1551(-)